MTPVPPSPVQKQAIFIKTRQLSSVRTQLPYEYYALPYCRPEKIVSFAENLGEVLRGDRIENSPYQVGWLPPQQACRGCAPTQQLAVCNRALGAASGWCGNIRYRNM
jgi:transmembrane 9 superfamily protein 2/4